MIGLYLLAAHLVGDFVLQSRWWAIAKLTDPKIRARHVTVYCLPFLAVLAATRPGWADAAEFLAFLWGYHFVVDSRRYLSNAADWIVWRFLAEKYREAERNMPYYTEEVDEGLPPNPWGPLPIVLDQTLHIVSLAILGGIYLT